MRRIIAFSLALLMLAPTLKVSLTLHFCKGKLIHSKFVIGYGEASCGMENTKHRCENRPSNSVDKIPCCRNQLCQITTDNYQPAVKIPQLAVEFTQASELGVFISLEQGFVFESFNSYRPPPNLTSVSLPFIKIFQI